MFAMLVIAHLLGDYVLQFNFIARWKARSLWGVAAHGGIVTVVTLLGAALIDVTWWPYALFIGVTHTLIDVVKAHGVHPKNTQEEMRTYLLDQVAHLLIITLTVSLSHAPTHSSYTEINRLLTPALLTGIIGYTLLLQPAWVLLRFIVRGVWGAEAVPHLGAGEKFEPMAERILIASFILAGAFYLTPLVLLPRRLSTIQLQGNGVGVWMRLTTHWAETFLGTLLAVGVGLALRWLTLGH